MTQPASTCKDKPCVRLNGKRFSTRKGVHQTGLPINKMRMIYSQKVTVCVSQSISLMVAIDSTW